MSDLKIVQSEALAQLGALGYTERSMVYLRFFVPSNDPRKADKTSKEPFSRGGYREQHKLAELPWARLEEYQRHGYGVYFVVNGQGHTDAEVSKGRAIWCEWDALPKEEQYQRVIDLGLPEPSMAVETRKSVHFYWILTDPLPVKQRGIILDASDSDDRGQWRILQERLLEHTFHEQKRLCSDQSLRNPSRVLRLAGCYHLKAGQEPEICQMTMLTELRYSFDQLIETMPEKPKPPAPPAQRPTMPPPAPGARPITGNGDRIPFAQLLSRSNQQLLAEGVPEGRRNDMGYRLARDLIGVEQFVSGLGITLDSTARQLLDDFAARCSPPLEAIEVEAVYQSCEKDNRGPSLSEETLAAKIAKFQSKKTGTLKLGTSSSPKNTTEPPNDPEVQNTRYSPKRWKLELLRQRYAHRVALNTLEHSIEIDGEATDPETFYIQVLLEHDLEIDVALAKNFLVMMAKKNQYSPVVRYLEAQHQAHGDKADQELSTMATDYLGATGDRAHVHNLMLRRFMIGLVRRALDPGCKLDSALVLQGPQGKKKSTFFKALSYPWFDDTMGDTSDRDERLKMSVFWINEWAELEIALSRRSVNSVKAFMSSSQDAFRVPYGHGIDKFPRTFVLVGTTNQTEFLADPTGSRRFWIVPVLVDSIDVKRLHNRRDQLFAAAVGAYHKGERHWFEGAEEEAMVSDAASLYQMVDPWEAKIVAYLELNSATEGWKVSDLLTHALKLETSQQTIANSMRCGDVLKRLGYIKRHSERGNLWHRPVISHPISHKETHLTNGHGHTEALGSAQGEALNTLNTSDPRYSGAGSAQGAELNTLNTSEHLNKVSTEFQDATEVFRGIQGIQSQSQSGFQAEYLLNTSNKGIQAHEEILVSMAQLNTVEEMRSLLDRSESREVLDSAFWALPEDRRAIVLDLWQKAYQLPPKDAHEG